MNESWLLASLHLIALGIGMGAVLFRGRALRNGLDEQGLGAVFFADNLWGASALLWVGTGLYRLFGDFEKGTTYYLNDPAFLVKMGLFVLVLLLEAWPMVTLIRWRIQQGRKATPDLSAAPALGMICYVETGLLVAIVFTATAVARGIFL